MCQGLKEKNVAAVEMGFSFSLEDKSGNQYSSEETKINASVPFVTIIFDPKKILDAVTYSLFSYYSCYFLMGKC